VQHEFQESVVGDAELNTNNSKKIIKIEEYSESINLWRQIRQWSDMKKLV